MKKFLSFIFPRFSAKVASRLFLHMGLFLLITAVEFSLAFLLCNRIYPGSPFLHIFSENSLLNELLQGAGRAAVLSIGFGLFFSYTTKKQERDSQNRL